MVLRNYCNIEIINGKYYKIILKLNILNTKPSLYYIVFVNQSIDFFYFLFMLNKTKSIFMQIKKSSFFKNIKKLKAFTLLELMLVLGIIVILSTLAFNAEQRKAEDLLAKNSGDQIKEIGGALNTYIGLHYEDLIYSVDAASGTPGGPRACNSGTGLCTITVSSLVSDGLLPTGYQGISPFNSSYTIQIARTGTAPNYQLDGLIITTQPWLTGGVTPRYDLLGLAIQEAGADAGETQASANTVSGYNGLWSFPSTEFPAISQQGLLAYRAGYASSQYASYLRRDGSLAMTGPLNMGGNSIINALDVVASGTVQSTNMQLNGGNLYLGPNGTNSAIGSNGTGASTQTVLYQDSGVLIRQFSTNNPAPIQEVGDINSSGYIHAATERVDGKLQSYGLQNGDSGSNQPMSNFGTLYTIGLDVLNPSGSPAQVTNALNVGGTLTAGQVITPQVNTDILTADTQPYISAMSPYLMNSGFYINNVATEATGCPNSALYARSLSGSLLICRGGVWSQAVEPVATRILAGPSTGGVSVLANCPAGYQISGGGYQATGFIVNPNTLAPQESYQVNNGWQVTSGSTNAFNAYATCIKNG